MNKSFKVTLFILVAISLSALVFLLLERMTGPSLPPLLPVDGFHGNLSRVDGNRLVVEGVYAHQGEAQRSEALVTALIRVSENTEIERESFVIPTGEAPFVVADLPKVKTQVSLEELKNDSLTSTLGLLIETRGEVRGGVEIEAARIVYRLPVFE